MSLNFFCDVMLGKLAGHLRMLGFDTKYSSSLSESMVIKSTSMEKRVLLTRRTKFLTSKISIPFLFITSNHPETQFREVTDYYKISLENVTPFSICLVCNTSLQDIERTLVEGKVPDYVFNTVKRFAKCPTCNKIFWKGTHFYNMVKRIDEALMS